MKRSKVIELIRNETQKLVGLGLSFDEAINDVLPEKILCVIEEVGMLSPSYSERLGCDCCSSYIEGEWEKE